MRFLAAPLVVLLAGCVVLQGERPDPDSPLALAWSLEGCRVSVALVPVPASRIVSRLPEGFRPLGFPEIGLAPDPRGDAILALEVVRCARATWGDEEIADAAYGGAFTLVEPPAELADANVTFHHLYRFDVALPGSRALGALAERGMAASAANATFTDYAPAGDLASATLVAANGTTTIDTAFALPSTEDGGRLVEFQESRRGLARWDADVRATFTIGGGRVLLPEGSLAREIAQAAQPECYVLEADGAAWERGSLAVP